MTVQVNAPEQIWEEAQSTAFRTDSAEPAICLELTPCDTLPEPEGRFLGTAGEKKIWQDGTRITRITKDRFRLQPHMSVCYDREDLSRVQAFVRREDWLWATRTKYLWSGVALNQLLLGFRTLFFHASYVAHENRGILFTAPSRTGKSTQAELWRKYRGARVINGDKAAVSLRERPMIHSIPFSGTSGICENRSLPLQAVVVLSQAPENTVRRMGPAEVLSSVCGNVFADQAVPEEWSRTLNLLLDLTASVPVYALACTPDERAVEALEQAMK